MPERRNDPNRREVLDFLCRSSVAYVLTETFAPVIAAGTLASGILRGVDRAASLQFTDENCQRLGSELLGWRLRSGVLMAQSFPDVKKTADLLMGRTDPRQFIPSLDLPIQYDNNTPDGEFYMNVVRDPSDSRSIEIFLPSGKIITSPWIGHVRAALRVSGELEKSTAKFPVIVKEASHIYDLPEYNRLYLAKARERGVKFKFNNPANIPTSVSEQEFNFSQDLHSIEAASGAISVLQKIVDNGGALRVGGILFANWYVDALKRKLVIPKGGWFNTGHRDAGYLQEKGLIAEEDNMVVWIKGQSPHINSPEFYSLLEDTTNPLLLKLP